MAEGGVQPTGRATDTGSIRHEVRFGVVMYGGVSLAVYINGVAQEMLALVRATAPAPPPPPPERARADGPLRFRTDELSEIEQVYRDLARVSAPGAAGDLGGPVNTRFVVDIISGSSAGGINGVYLAKALSENQSITSLKTLWEKSAGFGNILNDRKARGERRDALNRTEPADALFSGDRMYVELVDALDQMDADARADDSHDSTALVDDLDLWITATDLDGLVEPIQLADRTVPERRHRHVFHFVHGADQAADGVLRDFRSRYNPMLAFAARATSSFPFAFEPAQLADIERVIRTKAQPKGRADADDDEWHPWFARHRAIAGYDHTKVNFGDGGDMDNKPFGWVIDTLPSRTSTAPVDRRLIYVEPDPGDAVQAVEPPGRPDTLDSVIAAVSLGRVEQIRDEVERLNRRSETLGRIAAAADELHRRFSFENPEETTTDDWMTESAYKMRARGASYQTYYRLRVESLIEEFGRSLAQLGWAEPSSVESAAYQALTRTWIDHCYRDPFIPSDEDTPTTKSLLRDFDIAFRVRRLAFTAHWADVVHREADDELDIGAPMAVDAFRETLRDIKQRLAEAERLLRSHVPGIRARYRAGRRDVGFALTDADLQHFRADPVGWAEAAWERRKDEWLAMMSGIAEVIAKPSEDDDEAAPSVFQEASGLVAAAFAARDDSESGDPLEPAVLRASARASERIEFVYRSFASFDQVMFPLQVATGGGEIDPVDVYRISPQDADGLVDAARTDKVAGARFFHFGGFLDSAWRANDIMWGRLDTAERLITTLAPEPHRAELLARAHDAILKEEWYAADRRGHTEDPRATGTGPDDRTWRLEHFSSGFVIPDWPPRSELLHLAARSAQITADILEGLADRPGGKALHRVVAAVAWLLAAVATVLFPGGVKRSPIRAICVAALGVGATLIGVGTVTSWQTGKDAGWTTALAGLAGLVLILLARLGWRRPVRFVAVGVVALMAALAVRGALDLDGRDLTVVRWAGGGALLIGFVGLLFAATRALRQR